MHQCRIALVKWSCSSVFNCLAGSGSAACAESPWIVPMRQTASTRRSKCGRRKEASRLPQSHSQERAALNGKYAALVTETRNSIDSMHWHLERLQAYKDTLPLEMQQSIDAMDSLLIELESKL